ncbi:neuropathy target esterase sws isoform X2 [Nilaparvata lugens]|uniref:neuropathy target esterase sws isoform X2 n=1 Tax=Nilaparvata lugens TaxID=108931 RepID=UPI00193CFC0A|nr:neuropathy target esterase sws isoform X2 [Nilaparvata lugens]
MKTATVRKTRQPSIAVIWTLTVPGIYLAVIIVFCFFYPLSFLSGYCFYVSYINVLCRMEVKTNVFSAILFLITFPPQAVTWALFVCLSFLSIVIVLFAWKWKNREFLPEVKEFVGVGSTRPRFRKRDKVLFYGRKMLRKVKSISGQVHGGQGKKRKLVIKFARKLLQMKKENAPQQLKVLEPPAEFLQEDISTIDDRVPPDAFYMLQSIRVFGHFEKPIFLKLCKHTDILNLPAGSYLFKIGDPDENVYVVQNGKVNVFITGNDGAIISLKVVKTGDSVTSLLSFTDVLTGHPKPYKTVSARAVEDSTVVRLPMAAFQEVFQEYPEHFIRVMQVIMVRLQRVTFTALHQHLGLSAELVNPGVQKKKMSPSFGGASSPVKGRPRDGSEAYGSVQQQDNGFPFPLPHQMSVSDGADMMTSSVTSSQHQPTHRRSRSGFEMRFPHAGSQPPDIMPEFDHAPQIPPDIQLQQQQSGAILQNTAVTSQRGGKVGRPTLEPYDEAALIAQATEAFVRELGLTDAEGATLLGDGKVEIREVPQGTYLMKEESHKDVALVYLLTGTLVVSQKLLDSRSREEEEVHMFSAHPGEIVGGLAVLTGEPSFFTIRAKHSSRIALLSKTTVYNILREKPQVVLHIAHTVVKRLSPFVRQVDFALDWVFKESGQAVYRQEDESDSTFIVLSGRLRSVITHRNGKKELVGEYGKGDLVGIVEMVTQTPRSTTVIAVRDSELAKLPEGLFNAIKLRYPIVVTRLINLLGHRILGSWQKPSPAVFSPAVDSRLPQNNFSTVALIAVNDDVPLTAFTYELYHAVNVIVPSIRLTSEVMRKTLGAACMEQSNEYRLTSWLAQQEDQHRIALYQCDSQFTPWTQRCIRQADCVLIVGLGDSAPSVGKMEKEVERIAMRTRKELVLLHRDGGDRPNNTVAWLNMRSWVSTHHHIQCSKRMFTRRSLYRINELYSKVLMSEPNVHSDFSRLARWLTGTSVGLVLGGGGARGASHVGMVKAIQEAGIPIDMVGGVSIGAFMGALWCMERDVTRMTQKAREWSKKMTQWWRQLWDLTYPVTSMFTGRDFNQTIYSTFGDTYIEDLWLPYFTVTTDISASAMRIHTHGLAWKYIRASMSIAGIMPPICDPVDGHCLVDGCYVNNVPADVMRSQGAAHILAIDVGSQDDTDLTNYGDSLSGWWLLWKRFNPFTTPVKVPNLPDIQSRLAYVSCVQQLEEVKRSDYCEYIRPPIDKYKTLQFGSFDEIKDVGFIHGQTYFAGLMKAGPPSFLKQQLTADSRRRLSSSPSTADHHCSDARGRSLSGAHSTAVGGQQGSAATGYTFTDLAQMVCQVQPSKKYWDESSTSSDDYEADEEDAQEVGYVSEPSSRILEGSKSMLRRRQGGSLSLSENEIESETN